MAPGGRAKAAECLPCRLPNRKPRGAASAQQAGHPHASHQTRITRPKKNSTPDSVETPDVIRAWTYLLITERGEEYLGATTNLRQRLRSHNSLDSTQWTRGRKWHLLAVRGFATREEAFGYEHELKRGPHKNAEVAATACGARF